MVANEKCALAVRMEQLLLLLYGSVHVPHL
jgi:hypothetical protein